MPRTFWLNAAHAANALLSGEGRRLLRTLAQDTSPNDVAAIYLAEVGERLERAIGRQRAERVICQQATVIGFIAEHLAPRMRQHHALSEDAATEKAAELCAFICRRVEFAAKAGRAREDGDADQT